MVASSVLLVAAALGAGTGPAAASDGTWSSLDGGDQHTCAVRSDDASLWCWGDNSYGQLGLGTTDTVVRTTPVRVGTDRWSQVTAGARHTCAVRTDSTLWCWGSNTYGQLGVGDTATRTRPTQVRTATSSSFWMVSGGAFFTCGTSTDWKAHCWGRNDSGQLGVGDHTNRYSPVSVMPGTSFDRVTLGATHACATVAGQSPTSLWCWGANSSGQLGVGDTAERSTPVQVPGSWLKVQYEHEMSAFALGMGHSCGLGADRALYCWGSNYYGELGVGDLTARTRPTKVKDGTFWGKIAAGALFTCGTTTDVNKVMLCWGNNSNGQLGTGNTTKQLVPAAMGMYVKTPWAGSAHACARESWALKCWGYNYRGQVGSGSTAYNVTSPEYVG
ncbi:MAG: hypothetical protein U0Q15_02235 [Kineosporiaceae bacterium]